MSYNSEAKQLDVDEAAAVGILQHLDKNELQNLLEDTDKLDSLIQDLQQVFLHHKLLNFTTRYFLCFYLYMYVAINVRW